LYSRSLELEIEVGERRVGGQPTGRRRLDAPHLLLVDHLERVAECRATLLFHLDDEQPIPSPEHEVELVPADARIRFHEPVATKPVVTKGAALAAIHAASSAA